jgi:hypothetical protein
MRTPKPLYAQQRLIYQPELLTCPHCDDRLALCNYLAWDKTVQTLRGVLSVASRPSHCRHTTCEGAQLRLLSAEAQGIALAGSTYGYDVMVRIGWWRQHYHATYRETVKSDGHTGGEDRPCKHLLTSKRTSGYP